jgi:tetratricopeptide (TPR) repeat protein
MDYFRSAPNPGAEEIYRLALEIDPDNVGALALLATIHIRVALARAPADESALAEADGILRRAVQLDPTNVFVLLNTCIMYRLAGRIADAIATCRRALDIDPRYAGALRELGHDLLESGDAAQAIMFYRAAVEAGPYQPLVANAFKGQGVASLALGRREDAIASFQKSLQFDAAHEDDEQLWFAAALEMDGKRVEAARMLDNFMSRHPGLRVDDNYLRLLCAPAYADRRKEVLAALAVAAQSNQGQDLTPKTQ